MKPTIAALNEWSYLHNRCIGVLNKPKDIASGRTGFCMLLQKRYY